MRISDWSSDVCSSDLLLPLPSADPYRFLMTSPEFVTCAREIFKGQPGLEMAYPSAEGTAGELSEVIKAGYVRHAGIFGAHRHHHAVTDDLSTVTPDPLAATARGVRRSEEHTSELQSLMRISYAVFCLKKNRKKVI